MLPYGGARVVRASQIFWGGFAPKDERLLPRGPGVGLGDQVLDDRRRSEPKLYWNYGD